MAAGESYVRNQLYFVPLSDLQPDPNQPRKYLDSTALDELTASIVQHGVLIEIAAKKREDSMLTAYAKYKAGLNPRKKTQTAVKVSKAQVAFNAMDQTERKMKTLNIQALTAEEKQNFIIALENLKRSAEAVLIMVRQPAPEDENLTQPDPAEEPKPSINLA